MPLHGGICGCQWCNRPPGSLGPLVKKQKVAAKLATARGSLWEGSVRSAKTVSSLVKWSEFARKGPSGLFALIGITQDTLKRNIISPLQDLYGDKRVRFYRGINEMVLFDRKIAVLSAHNEADVKKLKGPTLASFYGDEITEWPEAVFRMAISRLSVEGAQWFGTTNPGGPGHWLLKDQLEKASLWLTHDGRIVTRSGPDILDLHRFSFRLADNPYLPNDYVDDIQRQYVGLWRKRLIEGLWCMAEGAVYDMFDPDRHVVSELPAMVEWISLGVDYGTTNPTSAVLIGLGDDGNLYAAAEWRYDSKKAFRQLTDAEYSQQIRAWLTASKINPRFVCVDPSAASFRLQLFRDGLRPAAADNDVGDGIRLVSSLLATDRLKIHKSCAGLIEELPSYTWDDRASAKGNDQPVKQNDHSVDALRYALMTTQAIWQYQLR